MSLDLRCSHLWWEKTTCRMFAYNKPCKARCSAVIGNLLQLWLVHFDGRCSSRMVSTSQNVAVEPLIIIYWHSIVNIFHWNGSDRPSEHWSASNNFGKRELQKLTAVHRGYGTLPHPRHHHFRHSHLSKIQYGYVHVHFHHRHCLHASIRRGQ